MYDVHDDGGAVQDVTGSAVASLLEQYQRPLFAYLARLVDDAEWAEELARETFLAALRAGDQLPGIADRRAWLFQIATRRALKALERRRHFPWITRRHASDHPLPGVQAKRSAAQQDFVEQALASLPAEQRAPLLLYGHHELSVVEVAAAPGISERVAKTQLYQARVHFRAAYEREVERAGPR